MRSSKRLSASGPIPSHSGAASSPASSSSCAPPPSSSPASSPSPSHSRDDNKFSRQRNPKKSSGRLSSAANTNAGATGRKRASRRGTSRGQRGGKGGEERQDMKGRTEAAPTVSPQPSRVVEGGEECLAARATTPSAGARSGASTANVHNETSSKKGRRNLCTKDGNRKSNKQNASVESSRSPQRSSDENRASGVEVEPLPYTSTQKTIGAADVVAPESAAAGKHDGQPCAAPQDQDAAKAAPASTKRQAGLQEKPRARDAMNGTLKRKKNVKSVTAGLTAGRVCLSAGVPPSSPPLPSPQPAAPSTTEEGAVPVPEPQSVSAATSDRNPSHRDALAIALHDPAIVQHHVRQASLLESGAAPSDPLAASTSVLEVLAKIPADPCVVKVVSNATILSVLPASIAQAGLTDGRGGAATSTEGHNKDAETDAFVPSLASNASNATVSPPAATVSEEDVQLSRRGLRFAAAPWRPTSASYALEGGAEAVLGATTVSVPLYSTAFALPSTTTTTTAAAAGDADVPTVTITSSLRQTEEKAAAARIATTHLTTAEGGVDARTLSPSPSPPSPTTQSQGSGGVAGHGPILPVTMAAAAAAAATAATTPASAVLFAAQLARMVSPKSLYAAPASTDSTGGMHLRSPQSLVGSPASSVALSPAALQRDASPLGESVGSLSRHGTPGAAAMAVAAVPASCGAATPPSVDCARAGAHDAPLLTNSSSSSAAATLALPPVWGTHSSTTSPSSPLIREEDRTSRGSTPPLVSPALHYSRAAMSTTSVATDTTITAAITAGAAATAAAAASAGADRPATAPAIRRSAMTVTNTATGARMSSSTLTTPSGSPMGQWAVVDGAGRAQLNHSSSSALAAASEAASGTAALTPPRVAVSGSQAISAKVRSSGSTDYSPREFPAMPFPASYEHATAGAAPSYTQPQQQQANRSLNSLGATGSTHNLADLNTGNTTTTIATTTTTTAAALSLPGAVSGSYGSPVGVGASHSGGSSLSGSPHISHQNSLSVQLPRNASSNAFTAGENTSSSLLLYQSGRYTGHSASMQGESDLDRVRHNRVAVSDFAAKDETTLVDTLFADAEADVVEDDESEMDLDDGRGSAAGGDWWPAYPMGTSPHLGMHTNEAYTRAYVKQQQQQQRSFASSPTMSGGGPTFGGGYWYQPGSTAGGPRQSGGGAGTTHPRFSPDHRNHRAISASCASVASSTMSLLDPRQPPADLGAVAYDIGDDEEEWEMNSSAYADSLDEAQIQWIEEQLKATENPAGYF